MFEVEGAHYSLRPASEDDLGRILEIEEKSYPLPWKREAFVEEIHKGFSHFLVLTDDATDSILAGYIVFWTLFDEAHVLNLTAAPDFRGLGVASLLMRHVFSEGAKRELKRVFLEVRRSNDAAVALYQKLGFYIDHIKKSFYENGEDAYFMVRYLTQQIN